MIFSPIIISSKNIGHSIDWGVPDEPLLLQRRFYVNNYVWWDNFNGIDRGSYMRDFFYNFIGTLPSLIFNLKGNILIKSYIVFTSAIGAYGFYILSNKLSNIYKGKSDNISSFVIGIFYSMSVFMINLLISGEFFGFHIAFGIIPFLFSVFIDYILLPSIKNVIKLSLVSTLVLIGWQQYMLLCAPILLALFIYIKKEIKYYIFSISIFIVILLFLNLWWILPIIYSKSIETYISDLDALSSTYKNHDITFRLPYSLLDIDWSWHFSINKIPTAYLYIILVIIGISSLFIKKVTKLVCTLFIIDLFYLSMAAGIDGPLGNLITFAINNKFMSWYIQIFRSPVDFLIGHHIIFAILLLFGLSNIINIIKSHKLKYLILSIIVIVILIPHISWSKYIEADIENDVFFNLYIENEEIVNFYKESVISRNILFVPPVHHVTFLPNENQHYRNGPDPLVLWAPSNVIAAYSHAYYINDYIIELLNSIKENNIALFIHKLNLLNIEYIILRKDVIATDPIYNISIGEVKNMLDNNTYFKKYLDGKSIIVYKFIGGKQFMLISNSSSGIKQIITKDLRIEPPVCNDNSINIEDEKTNIIVNHCIDRVEWIHVVKPFLLETNALYRFEIKGLSIDKPFYIKVYFQNMRTEEEKNALIDIVKPSQSRDAYYFHDKSYNYMNNTFYGYFDTINVKRITGEDLIYTYITIMLYNNDLTNGAAHISFDDITVYKTDIINEYPEPQYIKINPTMYKLKLINIEPTLLQFSQNYSDDWELQIYKYGELTHKTQPFALYSFLNGFTINEIGELELILIYRPQEVFEYALLVSLMTLLILLILFTIFYRQKVTNIIIYIVKAIYRR
ncbi:MAG: hypothetical protein QW416_04525 [Candidatus Nitrosocaldaceae archaeon]